ncbi:MAG: HD-GYP domain-containing protein [Sporolactobacillus sp.]
MGVLSRDLFDDEGRLLLSKNTKLTSQASSLLAKHGFTSSEINGFLQPDEKILKALKRLKKRVNQQNSDVLSTATDVLNRILIESREKPWGMYCSVLANYNDWLYTHSINVSLLSLMIAIKINNSDTELWNIGLGALLHDVGKLLIPKSLINRHGALNEHEFQIIKQHCELGESALANYDLDPMCLEIVKQHHERLDGSGYPDGLTGEQIAYGAKIVMISDSIDAMTSYRPYKNAYSIEEAMARLANDTDKYDEQLLLVANELLL